MTGTITTPPSYERPPIKPSITCIDIAQAGEPKGTPTRPLPDLEIGKLNHIAITISEQQAFALRTAVSHAVNDPRLSIVDCLSGCVAAALTLMNDSADAINEVVTVMDVSHPMDLIFDHFT
jgi:hypothetical protein